MQLAYDDIKRVGSGAGSLTDLPLAFAALHKSPHTECASATSQHRAGQRREHVDRGRTHAPYGVSLRAPRLARAADGAVAAGAAYAQHGAVLCADDRAARVRCGAPHGAWRGVWYRRSVGAIAAHEHAIQAPMLAVIVVEVMQLRAIVDDQQVAWL